MLAERPKQLAYLEAVVDATALCSAFLVAFFVRSRIELPGPWASVELNFASHFWLPCLGVPLFWALGVRRGLYLRIGGISFGHLLAPIAHTFFYWGLVLGSVIFLVKAKSFSRLVFLLFMLFGIAFVVAGKALVRRLAAPSRGAVADPRRVLIVGAGREALEIREKIERNPDLGARVVGHLSDREPTVRGIDAAEILGTAADLKRIVEERVVDDVIFAMPLERLVACEPQLAWCEEIGVTAHLKVDFVRTLLARTYPSDLEGTPMLTISATPRDAGAMLVKRALDLAIAGASLVVLAPVMLALALAVRLSSRGPVLFRQQRVGLNGRLFTLYKFRSMYRDAEPRKKELEALNEMSGPVFKIRHDPRVTPAGRWMRRFSLDELPQLWNVIRGDMSLVGPRPPLAEEVRRYERWQRRRLSMKPGVTCLWQVMGRNRIGFEEWMKLDLDYIDNWSLLLDLKILLRTVPVVLTARGAF